MKNWVDKFKEEFGIHFKSKGELQFAIQFIKEVEADTLERAAKVVEKEMCAGENSKHCPTCLGLANVAQSIRSPKDD